MLGIEERKIFTYTDLIAVEMQQFFGTDEPPGRVHGLAELGNREIYAFFSGQGVLRLRPGVPAEGYLVPVTFPRGR